VIHYGRLLGAPPHIDSPEVIKGNELFWSRSFPHEPYTLDLTVFADGCYHPASTKHNSKIGYDLHAAVDRQRKFSYQVGSLSLRRLCIEISSEKFLPMA
jgi:hypothetical protein